MRPTTAREIAANLRSAGPCAKWLAKSGTPGHGDWTRGWHLEWNTAEKCFDIREWGDLFGRYGVDRLAARVVALRRYGLHLEKRGFVCELLQYSAVLVVYGRAGA